MACKNDRAPEGGTRIDLMLIVGERQNQPGVTPPGLQVFPVYPGLTLWANSFRPLQDSILGTLRGNSVTSLMLELFVLRRNYGLQCRRCHPA